MDFTALATDYDGTIAHDGLVDAATIEGLARFKASGRALILVTGRELDELKTVFGRLDLFDLVVAENGALLYDPATGKDELLTRGPSAELAARLRAAGVTPLSVGHTIIATREPYETVALEAIRELGLELQIIFNKGAVMILPSDVNKTTGLKAALERLAIPPLEVVACGDAENDHGFLMASGCAVAVANAIPALKDTADIVSFGARGAGVVEIIDRLLATGLAEFDMPARHRERDAELKASAPAKLPERAPDEKAGIPD